MFLAACAAPGASRHPAEASPTSTSPDEPERAAVPTWSIECKARVCTNKALALAGDLAVVGGSHYAWRTDPPGQATLGDAELGRGDNSTAYIAAIGADGHVAWLREFSGKGNDSIQNIVQADRDHVFATGIGSMGYHPGMPTRKARPPWNPWDSPDTFVASLSLDGRVAWVQSGTMLATDGPLLVDEGWRIDALAADGAGGAHIVFGRFAIAPDANPFEVSHQVVVHVGGDGRVLGRFEAPASGSISVTQTDQRGDLWRVVTDESRRSAKGLAVPVLEHIEAAGGRSRVDFGDSVLGMIVADGRAYVRGLTAIEAVARDGTRLWSAESDGSELALVGETLVETVRARAESRSQDSCRSTRAQLRARSPSDGSLLATRSVPTPPDVDLERGRSAVNRERLVLSAQARGCGTHAETLVYAQWRL